MRRVPTRPRKEGIAKNKTCCSLPLHTSLPSLRQHIFEGVLRFPAVLFAAPFAFRLYLQVRDTFCELRTKRLMEFISSTTPQIQNRYPYTSERQGAQQVSALFMATIGSYQVRFDLVDSPFSSSLWNAAMSFPRRLFSHLAEC